MAVGDGVVWAESLPDNTTLASEIDDYDRDLRVGVRSRMALEHVWPSAHTGTGSGGRHTYITFQPQTAAPTMAGTTGGGLYVSTEVSPRLIFTRSNASDVTIVNTAGAIPIITTGTQGSLVIASSAASYGVTLLVASADGRVLHTHSNTAAPNYLPIDLAGTATVLTGVLPIANGGIGASSFASAFVAQIDTGTYTGNGSARDIAVDFTPNYVRIIAISGSAYAFDIFATGNQYQFGANQAAMSSAGALGANKFTVGTDDTSANTNGVSYVWVAFK